MLKGVEGRKGGREGGREVTIAYTRTKTLGAATEPRSDARRPGSRKTFEWIWGGIKNPTKNKLYT
jgi:hypothetical protein